VRHDRVEPVPADGARGSPRRAPLRRLRSRRLQRRVSPLLEGSVAEPGRERRGARRLRLLPGRRRRGGSLDLRGGSRPGDRGGRQRQGPDALLVPGDGGAAGDGGPAQVVGADAVPRGRQVGQLDGSPRRPRPAGRGLQPLPRSEQAVPAAVPPDRGREAVPVHQGQRAARGDSRGDARASAGRARRDQEQGGDLRDARRRGQDAGPPLRLRDAAVLRPPRAGRPADRTDHRRAERADAADQAPGRSIPTGARRGSSGSSRLRRPRARRRPAPRRTTELRPGRPQDGEAATPTTSSSHVSPKKCRYCSARSRSASRSGGSSTSS
jgi:hypothetical protein